MALHTTLKSTSYPITIIDNVVDTACLAVAIALGLMIDRQATGLIRTFLALAFVVYVPGRAIAINWPSIYLRSRIVLPILLALAINTLAATTILWLHEWHPLDLFGVEAIASSILITLGLWRRNHRLSNQSS
ncbi:MAG: hypothetical protein M1131_05605 [Actinobacteria bacterium]|jgi:hypothetical protein|nr:hypothetical protein [Actinomycetota bacterium]